MKLPNKKSMLSLFAVLRLFTALLTAMLLAARSDAGINNNFTLKPPVILVHGAWQAAYVWDRVAADLKAEGYRVSIVSLPAHGNDNTPAYKVSLQAYVDEVKKAIDMYNEPVMLVGHSLGGAVITQTAAELPSKIAKLVYIAGFIPQPGKSVQDYSMMDPSSLLSASIRLSDDQTLAGLTDPEINLPKIFAQDANDTQKKWLTDRYKAEPTIPIGTPLNYTKAAYDSAGRKYYIHTTADQAISFGFQQRMATEAGITDTFRIDTGHSPFVSKPEEVTKLLKQIAEK